VTLPETLFWPALVTLLALLLLQLAAIAVGRARIVHLVTPPAMDGPEPFRRAVRVQQNTLEQIVFFLPAFWLAVLLSNPRWAALLGILWLAGRLAYAVGYLQAPERRGAGFAIAMLSSLVLWLMATVGLLT
jgi:glutathione S-transferase